MTRLLHATVACFVATAVMVAVVLGAGDAPLTKAVKAGDLQAVRTLVKQGADVNAPSGDGSIDPQNVCPSTRRSVPSDRTTPGPLAVRNSTCRSSGLQTGRMVWSAKPRVRTFSFPVTTSIVATSQPKPPPGWGSTRGR